MTTCPICGSELEEESYFDGENGTVIQWCENCKYESEGDYSI